MKNNGLKYFFWGCFLAFLAASIPHVAYFFRAYEPTTNSPLDLWYWCVSYAIAGSIDLTVFLLSMTVESMHRQKKPGILIFTVWVFILALAVLSLYMNEKYAQHFVNPNMISATPISISSVKITDINPIIASMFQVMAICYTWISDKLLSDIKPRTAAQLQAEADELAAISVQQARIKAQKRANLAASLGGALDIGNTLVQKVGSKKDAKTMRDERLNAVVDYLRDAQELLAPEQEQRALTALSSLLSLKQSAVLPYLIAARSAISREQEAAQKANEFEPETEQDSDILADRNTDEIETPNDQDSDIASAGKPLRGPIYATFEQAMQSTGYSKEYLQRLVRTGAIQTKKNDKNRLLVSSLNAYLETHKRSGNTSTIPAIPRPEVEQRSVQSEDEQEPDTLQIVVQALCDKPDSTDEELAALLGMQRPASARFWRLKAQSLLKTATA